MEIYRLKDEVPKGRKRCDSVFSRGDDADNVVLKITEMKQGVKNSNRVNVYVNGSFSLSLDVAQVVDLGLKVGMVLTEERLEELKKASEFGKLYQRALEWVLLRPRSVRETRDYLSKKVYEKKLDKKYVDEVIGRLNNKGYLDDHKFAEFWVENRFVKKGASQKRLRMELAQKGVDKEVINEVLDGRNDEEELRKMVARKSAKYDDPQKLMAYLCRQGFSYELVRKVVEEG